MREPLDRLMKDTIVLRRRTNQGYPTDGRGVMVPTYDSTTLQGSYQFIQRQTTGGNVNDRMASGHSARVFLRQSDLPLDWTFPRFTHEGDNVVLGGRTYLVRGEPFPVRRDRDGVIVSWAFDADYQG